MLTATVEYNKGELIWEEPTYLSLGNLSQKKVFSFKEARYSQEKDYLPYVFLLLEGKKIQSISIKELVFQDITTEELSNISGLEYVKTDVDLSFKNGVFKKKNQGIITFTPIVKVNGKYKKIIKYELEVNSQKSYVNSSSKNKSFSNSSKLETGDWYKVAVIRDGVYKLSYKFLKNIGFDVDNINPQEFKIYGGQNGLLPELNSANRVDDIKQLAIYVEGESDGVFNKNDYILFYGKSPNTWSYNSTSQVFQHELNDFSDTSFYFITVDNTGETSKRISQTASLPTFNVSVNKFDDYQFYEKDELNLIKSGNRWFGEYFDLTTQYDFAFNFPNIDLSTPVDVFVDGAGRSSGSNQFSVTAGTGSFTVPFSGVNLSCYYCSYADYGSNSKKVNASSSIIPVKISYNKPQSGSVAWLNKIEVNARRNLIMDGDKMFFRDIQSIGIGNVARFSLQNANNVGYIWDVTDPFNVLSQQYTKTNNTITFNTPTDSLKQFVALTSVYDSIVFNKGKVQNQNLHGLSSIDYIIISHPKFLNQANILANYHQSKNGFDVSIVTPTQIYNEFSGGKQDIVAIRDFVRMLYEKASSPNEEPKYLLLFGDGSYDNKDRISGNSSFIPTYQSAESFSPTKSYVSDDYYGLLDPNEGRWLSSNGELVDIGIGRFPVKTNKEAEDVVNKIINYKTSSTMKDWRNLVVYIGDDEDGNAHMYQADQLSTMVDTSNREYNIDKIFFDAYQQESTPGGERYPEVNKSINQQVNNGALIVNYTGHGGEVGWAHERVLGVTDINNWTNKNMPLFVTATCEFSRFDDPTRTSAGELVFLNPNGGGIGLLTTVRLVYSSPNFALNTSFYKHVFKEVNNQMPRLGDLFLQVKNENGHDANTRNFTLLGDPALKLAYPKHDVIITNMNGNPISSTDTIKALSKVTIDGYVANKNGQKLSSFNGTIYPTIFDKKKAISTLNNDGNGVFNFNLQTSKLFKGKVSVVNGDFSYSFIVPKDIAYNYGKGKMSYYAENQEEDANGYFKDFYIGGTAANYAEDNKGPEIELYMNDRNFVFGGITDENPSLLAYVRDEHGINMVGNGIGHDIIAILDDKTEDAFVLNDFYEADLNSYQSGTVKYPFEDLSEGRHTLTLKVWDVYNNSSEETIEFVVVKSKGIVLEHVYNYPNPFTTNTEFWFEHNQPGKQMFAQVQIFTISGKLVKTIEKHVLNQGYRSNTITWNGLDDFGDKLGKGVYIYKLKVRAEDFSVAEKYQKIVIL